jgi:hypothetical protein
LVVAAMQAYALITPEDLVTVVHSVIQERWGRTRGICSDAWNDHPDTTWEDVAWVAAETDRRLALPA